MTTRPALVAARKGFGKHGGILRTGEELRLGIPSRTLYELRDRGDWSESARTLPPSECTFLTNPDCVTVANRAPLAVFCLISALSYRLIVS
jgi:hypothetical protein